MPPRVLLLKSKINPATHFGILWIRNGSVQEVCIKYITFGELFWGLSLGRAGIPYSKISPATPPHPIPLELFTLLNLLKFSASEIPRVSKHLPFKVLLVGLREQVFVWLNSVRPACYLPLRELRWEYECVMGAGKEFGKPRAGEAGMCDCDSSGA